MSAETIHRAAAKIREDWPVYVVGESAFRRSVADWLDAIAPRFPARLRDFEEHLLDREQSAALAVARVVLDERA